MTKKWIKAVLGAVLGAGLLGLVAAIFVVPGGTAADEGFATWQKQQAGAFDAFVKEADREFYDFLQAQWKEFSVQTGEVQDPAPKPETPPEAPEARPDEIENIMIERQAPTPPAPKPLPSLPSPEPVSKLAPDVPKKVISFAGRSREFPVAPELSRLRLSSSDRQGVAGFWKDFAGVDIEPVRQRLDEYRRADRMNDWLYLGLVKELGRSLFPDANTARLFCWAVMLKSGYDIRVGIAGETIHLLYPAVDDLYGVSFFSQEDRRYYIYTGRASRLITYEADYAPARTALDIFFHERPPAGPERRERVLRFPFQGRDFTIKAHYDPLVVELMDTLPQFALEKYVTADPGQMVRPELVSALAGAMRDLPDDPVTRVNFLLRFVQRAFEYKTDTEQFNRQRFLFPEEILHYPWSDCDDRCILFVCLVRALTDLDVVVLDYPGHVAAAVHVPGEGHGDYVALDGKKYYVTDPTYINADLGMTMPDFRRVKPVVQKVTYEMGFR